MPSPAFLFCNSTAIGKRGSTKIDESVEEAVTITPDGGEISLKGTTVTVPEGAVKQDTSVSLLLADNKHLIPMLKASGWEKIVHILTAIHIDCSPPTDHFDKPVSVLIKLPAAPKLGSNGLIRLMHSNYLRHWEDITDDVFSSVSITGDKVRIQTNLPGWLAVSVIQFDATMIAQMVLKSITVDPVLLRLNTYGFIDAERNSFQIALFVVPCKSNEEPIHREIDKPKNFSPISFPHTIQAYPNERLRVEILGAFEPDRSLSETDLFFEMDVQQKHNQIHTKWIKMTSSGDQLLSGKMKISTCRSSLELWEPIASISLSMSNSTRTPSSSSDH